MPLLEFQNDPRLRTKRRRGRPAEDRPDLVQLLAESIELVNARAARREPGARAEQDNLVMLLTWSIRLIEVSRARAGQVQPAAQMADHMEEEYVDGIE